MKVKSFYKKNEKNVIEYEDGTIEECEKEYLTDYEIKYYELLYEIKKLWSEVEELKKKVVR